MFGRLHEFSSRSRRYRGTLVLSILLHAVVLAAVVRATASPRAARVSAEPAGGDAPVTPIQDLEIAAEPQPSAPVATNAPALAGPPVPSEAPDTLRLGEPRSVRLALPPLEGSPADSAPAEGRDRVRISRIRVASLSGPGLDVRPASPAVQLADSLLPTAWRWTATPRRTGPTKLSFVVQGVVVGGDEERLVVLARVEQDVVVVGGLRHRMHAALLRHEGWVLGALLLGVAVWIQWRAGRARRNARP